VRVVCPYVPGKLAADAAEALREQAPDCEFVDVSSSPVAYWELLRDLWADTTDDLLIVEHDVTIAAGTVAALEACPEPWCSCPAPGWRLAPKLDGGTHWTASYLQCNRWRASFIAEHADALELPMMERGWWQLDTYVLGRLPARCHLHLGHQPHHTPRTLSSIRELQRESIAWKAEHPATPLLAAVYRLGERDDRDAHLRLALGKLARQALGDDAALAVLEADDPHAALAGLVRDDVTRSLAGG
jgi:hypothetical protein